MHFEVFQDITWKLFKKQNKKNSSFSALASLQNHHKAKSQPKLTEPIFIGASQFFMHTTGDSDAQQGFKNHLSEWNMIP